VICCGTIIRLSKPDEKKIPVFTRDLVQLSLKAMVAPKAAGAQIQG
jgi:hypothetical protein